MTNEDGNTTTVEMHDLPTGVQGLIQLGRNAIDRVSELERAIAERDETIRQLRAQLDEYERAPTVAWLMHTEDGDAYPSATPDVRVQDDPPNLECMKPLYAHPLALREPTDDECREIADRFLCEVANAARGVRTGRAMFNAVREVMKK